LTDAAHRGRTGGVNRAGRGATLRFEARAALDSGWRGWSIHRSAVVRRAVHHPGRVVPRRELTHVLGLRSQLTGGIPIP
jgi:hypothetical protein